MFVAFIWLFSMTKIFCEYKILPLVNGQYYSRETQEGMQSRKEEAPVDTGRRKGREMDKQNTERKMDKVIDEWLDRKTD